MGGGTISSAMFSPAPFKGRQALGTPSTQLARFSLASSSRYARAVHGMARVCVCV